MPDDKSLILQLTLEEFKRFASKKGSYCDNYLLEVLTKYYC
jgi:hypothetical protein